MCIECDGEQHFKPIKFFGGEPSYKTRMICDDIKTKFCDDNEIFLLRIPYTKFNNIEEIVISQLHLLDNQ